MQKLNKTLKDYTEIFITDEGKYNSHVLSNYSTYIANKNCDHILFGLEIEEK